MMADDPWAAFNPQPAAPAAADPWASFNPQPAGPEHVLTITPRQTSPGWVDTVTDAAKSFGTGIERGAIATATLPATVDRAGKAVVGYLADKALGAVGLLPQPEPNAPQPPDLNNYVGPEAVTRGAEAIQGSLYDPQTTTGKFAEKVGEFVPSAAVGGGAGLASRLATQAVLPGIADEAAGEAAAGTPYEGAARLVGAALAPGAAGLARRAVTPLPITAERQAMVDTLRNEGVDLTAGQVTGSKPLQYAESAAAETPLAGGRASEITTTQRSQFTSAALRRMGETADAATPDVMQRAATRIGNVFETLGARTTMSRDPQLGQDLGNVMREYGAVLPSERRQAVINQISDIMATPQMAGDAYQTARSRLSRASNNTRQSDPEFSMALGGIRDALDDAMGRSVPAADRAAWQEARRQWGAMRLLEKAGTGAGETAAQGMISPPALRNAVATRDRTAYARGRGDFADFARAGEAVMRPLPNSGTAGRSNAMNMMHLMAAGGGGAAGGVPGAIAGLAAPSIAARLLMSRPVQGYLGNQLLAGASNGQNGFLDLLLRSNTAGSPLLSNQGR